MEQPSTTPGQQDAVITCSLNPRFSTPAQRLQIRLGYMEEGAWVDVPLDPAPSVIVEMEATGVGMPKPDIEEPGTVTVKRVTLTPFTCKMELSCVPVNGRSLTTPWLLLPLMGDGVHTQAQILGSRLLFRMEDGSVHTQTQLLGSQEECTQEGAYWTINYRFHEVQDLERIQSIIVSDMEYPLDGSSPHAIAHDPALEALDPITVPHADRLVDGGAYPIPVRALTEGLGGTCIWDPDTGDIICTYRGVPIVLHPGKTAVTVNGEERAFDYAPAVQDGSTVAEWGYFFDAWELEGYIKVRPLGEEYKEEDVEIYQDLEYGDFYIIP